MRLLMRKVGEPNAEYLDRLRWRPDLLSFEQATTIH